MLTVDGKYGRSAKPVFTPRWGLPQRAEASATARARPRLRLERRKKVNGGEKYFDHHGEVTG